MQFVINEWLWADSAGDNWEGAQRETFALVAKLIDSSHQVVVIEGSAFDLKFWGCCSSGDSNTRKIALAFFEGIRINLDRCIAIDVAAAAEIAEPLLSSVKHGDHYLIRALLSAPGSVLVTTDAPLRDVVRQTGLTCLSREEFIRVFV